MKGFPFMSVPIFSSRAEVFYVFDKKCLGKLKLRHVLSKNKVSLAKQQEYLKEFSINLQTINHIAHFSHTGTEL